MNKCIYKLFFSLFLLTVFCGIGESSVLKEKIKEYDLPVYLINNESFVSLRSLLKAIECADSWGKIEDRFFFIYKGSSISMAVGYPDVIFQDRTEKLAYPVKERAGEILIHVESFDKILSGVDKQSAAGSVGESSAIVRNSDTGVPLGNVKDFIILIDPGHGGKDGGAVGNYGLKEKDVNLDVSKRLRGYLKKRLKNYPYITIQITRETDVYLSLEDRVQMAKDMNADIFFCVHTNSSMYNNLSATGFETYYPKQKTRTSILPFVNNSEGILDEVENDSSVMQIVRDLNETTTIDASKILAEIVQEKLAERLITPDRGAKRRNFYILKYTPMVSVLTEIGFICNPNIEANLRDVAVRQAIGETLGSAILEYLKMRQVLQ